MFCHHCGSTQAPRVRDAVCIPCASDVFYGRMVYGTHRFLVQEDPHGGDEYRPDRVSSEWALTGPVIWVEIGGGGRWRRRVRLEKDAQRFLDVGETVRATDEAVDLTAPDVRWQPVGEDPLLCGQEVKDPLRFRRALYVGFAPKACTCTNRTSLLQAEGDVPADICIDCGHIYALDTPSVVVYPNGRKDCVCNNASPIAGKVETEPNERAVKLLQGIRNVEVTKQMRCNDCGAIWDAHEWAIRKSPYPDMTTPDPDHVRAALTHGNPKQASYIDAYLLNAEEHRWNTRLRDAVALTLGKEEVDAIDKSINEVVHTVHARAGSNDRVATTQSTDVVSFVRTQLDAMEAHLDLDAVRCRDARIKLLTVAVEAHGWPQVVTLLEPVLAPYYKESKEARPELVAHYIEAIVADIPKFKGKVSPGDLSESGLRLLTSLLEHVAPIEQSTKSRSGPDLRMLMKVHESWGEPIRPSTLSRLLDKAPPDPLAKGATRLPGQEIKKGDVWLDADISLGLADVHYVRPVHATIGRFVPDRFNYQQTTQHPSIDAEPASQHWNCVFRTGGIVNAPPDLYRELRAWAHLAGEDPDQVPLPSTKRPFLGAPLVVTSELEGQIVALLAAANVKVTHFLLDRKHKAVVVHVADGEPIVIPVQLDSA